jgi:adenylate cyclase
VSIGFVDIRGFTSLSEGLTASQLAHFLNDYLSLMTEIILKEKGMVDKYIGDAIMMLFGAPNALGDQAVRVCRTALAMQRVVKENQIRWQKFGFPKVDIGVGINTGIAAVGNMGSAFRFDYTAMGDSVNVASRLEGLNKVYGTELIVGPETYAATADQFWFRELDFVRVKGKQHPVRIYELLGQVDLPADFEVLVGYFSTGLTCFRQRDWITAQSRFESCLGIRPNDGPSRYYLEMVHYMIANPPPPDWEGISVMEHK